MSPLLGALVTFAAGGCDDKAPETASRAREAATRPTPAGTDVEPIAHIPIGEMTSGSRPGDPGRHPALEIAETPLKLGPFRIDRFPYPGPGQPPRLGVSQEEAAALCSAREGRLCTEAEWERACRGPTSARYPSGGTPCTNEEQCVSGFDVVGMTARWEWTASRFGSASRFKGKPVVRGGGATAATRRCASRRTAARDSKEETVVEQGAVAFRCCYGAPNAAQFDEPELGPAYEPTRISTQEFRALLAKDERTSGFASSARLFEEEAARTVLARGPGDTKGFSLTTSPVFWQPSTGSRFLVVAGSDGDRTSFVVVFHALDDERSLAASFVMQNEKGPIALAYAQSIRPRIHFSGCWGCPGETGKALFRPPEDVVMLQP